MADQKISAMPDGAPAQGTDVIPIDRAGVNDSLTIAEILTADVHASYSEYTGQTSDAAAPSSAARTYVRNLSGRYLPFFRGPSGVPSGVQPGLFANNVTMFLNGTGATAPINLGTNWTVSTTQSTPTIANTNFMTQMKRTVFTTTTTASNTAGPRSTTPVCWRGNAAGQGGFFFAARWGVLTYTSTMRAWCGLSGLTTALTAATDPSAINDTVCMSKDTGETTWQVMTRDTSTTSKTTTGRATAAAGSAEVFDFYAWCAPNDSQITVRVVDITTPTVLVDNVSKSSNLPTSTVMLTAHCEAQNQAGGGGSAVAIFLAKLYIETDA